MGVRDLTCGKAGDWTSPAAFFASGIIIFFVCQRGKRHG